ncbi:MAG: HD-GYP domain-containing protein [Fusobacteriota bacterium]
MSKKVKNLKISEITPGMKIGKTIVDHNSGEILIEQGQEITHHGLKELKLYFKQNKGDIKIKAISDKKHIFKIDGKVTYLPSKSSKYVKDAISAKTQQEALTVVDNVIKNVRMGEDINSEDIKKAVGGIISDMMGNEDAVINLLDIKKFDDYTYTHSVNVATISLMIGKELEISKDQLFKLGEGALLHDLGKIKVEEEILKKPGRLTEDEFEIIKKHPVYTYQILKEKKNIAEISKYIALQHHEKFDGMGYPLGLKSEKINYFAKIVAIADVYDALTSRRPYKDPMTPYKAMKIIIEGSGTHFDPELLEKVVRILSIYPPGTHVLLNTNEKAVVKKVNKKNKMGPIVGIIGEGLKTREVDLSKSKKYFIKKVLGNDE